MAAIVIGKVRSENGKQYSAKYDESTRKVHISYAGWTLVGKAASASEALRKAELWLRQKDEPDSGGAGIFF